MKGRAYWKTIGFTFLALTLVMVLWSVLTTDAGAASPLAQPAKTWTTAIVPPATNVSGTISVDTTWTLAGSPYVVTGDVLVAQAVILTIQPGVQVRFNPGRALRIDGGLVARGTGANGIVFSSSNASPQPGDWGYILFGATSIDATYDGSGNYLSGSILEYATVQYAGSAATLQGAVRLDNAAPYIHNATIQHNANGGIYSFNGGTPHIVGNTVTDNTTGQTAGGGIYVSGAALLSGNTVSNNSMGSSASGGGIYAQSGANVTNNTVTGNTLLSYGHGAGIYLSASTATGNTVSNNSSAYAYGGGLYATSSTVSNNIVSNNTVTGSCRGCGMYITSNSTATGNTINGNVLTAGSDVVYGGGLYAISSTVTDNTISDNTLNGAHSVWGGGLYANSCATVSNNRVSGNTSTASYGIIGGGVYQYDGSFTGNTVSNNSATSNSTSTSYDIEGGGVYFQSSGSFTANTIADNTARTTGANVPIYGAGACFSGNGSFQTNAIVRNQAITNGGFVFGAAAWLNSTGQIKENTVIGNIAPDSDDAGGLYIAAQSTVINNNLYANGDAAYLGSDLANALPQTNPDLNANNNYWGMAAADLIPGMISDWYDDLTKGLVDYEPFVTLPNLNAPLSPPTGLRVEVLSATSVRVSWAANPESDVTGYLLYYTTDTFPLPKGAVMAEVTHTLDFPATATVIDVGNVTQYTINGLTGGTLYKLSLRAYEASTAKSWYASTLTVQPSAGAGSPPNTPSNTSPPNGATNQSVTPTLVSSAFVDPDGDTHQRSQWQIAASATTFVSPLYDSGPVASLTSYGVPTSVLVRGQTYYWRVRHQDSRSFWSAWSAPTSFTVGTDPSRKEGRLCANATWTTANSPYFVAENVFVCEGAILTIQPGVTLRFAPNKAMRIDGGLSAQGTQANRIVFSSSNASPQPGDWGYLFFGATSIDATYDGSGNYLSGSILEYATVQYAGSAPTLQGAVRLDNAAPYIHNATIQHNANGGIYSFNGGTPHIVGNTVSNNTTAQTAGGGIYVSGGALLSGNTVSNNSITLGSSASGGGIYAQSGANVTNNTVTGNTLLSYGHGAGIYVSASTATGNTVSNNSSANAYGGGLYATSSTVSNNTVSNNTVSGWCYGCGMYIETNSTATGNTITGNVLTAGSNAVYGGGLYAISSTVTDNTISDNTLNGAYSVAGGGLYASSCATVSNNRISGNTSTASYAIQGGGVYQYSGSFTGNTVSNNSATSNSTSTSYDIEGGGVYFQSSGSFTANTIADNTARTTGANVPIYGAGVYFSGNGSFQTNAIVRNQAITNGGFVFGAAAYLNSASQMTCNTVANNVVEQESYAGGVYVVGTMQFRTSNVFGNAGYDFWNSNNQGTPNVNATANYWGTTQAAQIQAMIYDWYDNPQRGIVDYSGFVASQVACAPPVPQPEIVVTPALFDLMLEQGLTVTRSLTITNSGVANLSFAITDTVAWLGQAPNSGSITPGNHQMVNVTFNTTGLAAGIYATTMHISNNDPDENPTLVPVTLTVTAPPVISDIRTSNVRDTSFSVSWLTHVPSTGEIHYGTTPTSLTNTVYDMRGAATFDDTHYVILQGLNPATTYYFDVVSGSTINNNGGAHFSLATGPTLGVPASDTIFGQVFKQNGTSLAVGTIVYITLHDADASGSPGDAALLSALVESNGYWNTNLGNARVANLGDYFEYSASGDQVRVQALGGADGSGCQSVDTNNDTPVPSIILGVSPCSTSYTLNLATSWNHISLPIDPLVPLTAEAACTAINSQGGHVSEIDRWYASSWSGHICGLAFNNFNLVLGSDYFVKTTAASAWSLEGWGVTTPVALTLQIGWNSIGVPHTGGFTAETLCQEIISQGVTAQEIDRWFAGGWAGHVCGLPFNDFPIAVGTGYFVKASSAGVVIPTLDLESPSPVLPDQPVEPPAAPTTPAVLGNLRISNVSDTAFTVSWISDQADVGYVRFGTTADLDKVAYDVRPARAVSDTHFVTVSGLEPQTTYIFDVITGDRYDDNAGVHYSVTTFAPLETPPVSDTIYGQVFQADGVTPAAGVIVYLTLADADQAGSPGEAGLLAAIVDEHGYWFTNLGNARLADGSVFAYSPSGDLVTLTLQTGRVTGTPQPINTADLRPAPPLWTGVRLLLPWVPR